MVGYSTRASRPGPLQQANPVLRAGERVSSELAIAKRLTAGGTGASRSSTSACAMRDRTYLDDSRQGSARSRRKSIARHQQGIGTGGRKAMTRDRARTGGSVTLRRGKAPRARARAPAATPNSQRGRANARPTSPMARHLAGGPSARMQDGPNGGGPLQKQDVRHVDQQRCQQRHIHGFEPFFVRTCAVTTRSTSTGTRRSAHRQHRQPTYCFYHPFPQRLARRSRAIGSDTLHQRGHSKNLKHFFTACHRSRRCAAQGTNSRSEDHARQSVCTSNAPGQPTGGAY